MRYESRLKVGSSRRSKEDKIRHWRGHGLRTEENTSMKTKFEGVKVLNSEGSE